MLAPVAAIIVPGVPVSATAPPPKPPAQLAPEPPPRAVSPLLDSTCVVPPFDVDAKTSGCDWDAGFPAISGDGKQIVAVNRPVGGGRGKPGLSIRFIDTRTSKMIREMAVLSPDEYEPEAAGRRAMLAKIAERAAAVQRTIDTGEFRAMTSLGSSDDEDRPLGGALIAEFAGDAVRVIDNISNVVLWQRRFAVEAEFPAGSDPGDIECHPTRTSRISLWWDDATRTALAEATYAAGSSPCGATDILYVSRSGDREAPAGRLEPLLAENPSLAFLLRYAPKLHFELGSCDDFGEEDGVACMKEMGWRQLRAMVEQVDRPDEPQHIYCASYNRPIVGDRRFVPFSGFRCLLYTQDWAVRGELEYVCEHEEAARACALRQKWSNDDEDAEHVYRVRILGSGKSMTIEGDRVSFSAEHSN